MIMDVPMMSLTFCNFSIKTELILFAPQPQVTSPQDLKSFCLNPPLVHTLSTYMWIEQSHKRQKPKNSRRN